MQYPFSVMLPFFSFGPVPSAGVWTAFSLSSAQSFPFWMEAGRGAGAECIRLCKCAECVLYRNRFFFWGCSGYTGVAH